MMKWGAGLAVLIAPWIADGPEADPSSPDQAPTDPSNAGEQQP